MKTNDPVEKFMKCLREAERKIPIHPNAMALATADRRGHPTVRFVLLKKVGSEGFVFYTDKRSHKGRTIAANLHVSAVFYWSALKKQIRIDGVVTEVKAEEADRYWATRSRGSKISAWSSHQGTAIKNRRELLRNVIRISKRFQNRKIPRPAYWTGYLLVPRRIEFMDLRRDRLHHRELYLRTAGGWRRTFLQP